MKIFYVKAFFISCVGILISINSFGTGTIKGTVTYHDLFGMDNIDLYLYDSNENIVDSTITNSVGFYIFNQIPFGDYILRGNVDQLAFGVDLEDAYLIEQYLLGNDTLSDFQLFTADVDGDGSVTWNDYYTITDWWLTYGIPFPVGEWKFEELEIAFYTTADGDDNDAKVTSTGDVDGGSVPDKITPANIESLPFEQIIVKETDIIEVPIYIENDINIRGYHLSIKYNNAILEILDVKTLNSNGIFNQANGTLKITCLNINSITTQVEHHTAIATLTIKLKGTLKNSDLISFLLTESPQFMDENGKLLKNIQLSIPKIKIESESFRIINSYPNPFITTTNIEYVLPEAGNITICIYNVSGMHVHELITEYKEAGVHQFHFDGSYLLPGMYMYRMIYTDVEHKKYIKTGSMIKSN